MSLQNEQTATRAIGSERRPFSRAVAEAFLRRMLRGLQCGQLIVDTPAGERLVFEGVRPGSQAKLTIHSWRCIWRLVMSSDVGFAEGYRAGEWSSPNLTGLLRFACETATSGMRNGLPVSALISRAMPMTLFQSGRFGVISKS